PPPVLGPIDDDGHQADLMIAHFDHATAELETGIVRGFDLDCGVIAGLLQPGLHFLEAGTDIRAEDRLIARRNPGIERPACRQGGDAYISALPVLQAEAGTHVDQGGYEELTQLVVAAFRFKPCQPMYQLLTPPLLGNPLGTSPGLLRRPR